MSQLLSEQTGRLRGEAQAVCCGYMNAREVLMQAELDRRRVIAELRQAIIDGSSELTTAALQCSVLTILAVHRGDADAAYAFARGCFRAMRAVREGEDLIYGRPNQE